MERVFDVAIIGAGILGCTLARTLSRYNLDICVVEAALDVGEGSTKSNSGLIHTGFHPRGGSLKGTSCVKGNKAYPKIVEELQVPFKQTGALYVSFHDEGMQNILEKQKRAQENGAGELPIISGEEARLLEPRLSPQVKAALFASTTGIISPFDLVFATAANAAANGVQFIFDFCVSDFERQGTHWLVHSQNGERVRARFVVNMSGEAAAILDAKVTTADIIVRPRRGQFIVFDKQKTTTGLVGSTNTAKAPVEHVLFQAQEEDEGGILLAPTIDGNLLVGPTSENVRTFSDNATTLLGIDRLKRVAQKLIPDIELGSIITEFSGIRANITNVIKEKKDFVVRISAPGFISALGIKNPGMTAAPALAEQTLELLRSEGLDASPNPHFDARSRGASLGKPFIACSAEEQKALLKADARFGHVVCRCEHITEGDIRSCLHNIIPPKTLDGVKRRLRCGMGRCQGGFCTSRVINIMADELSCSPQSILRNERGGHVVKRQVKSI